MALEEPHKTDDSKDEIIEESGVSVVFEKKLSSYVKDKMIDYKEGYQQGFTIYSQRGNMGCN